MGLQLGGAQLQQALLRGVLGALRIQLFQVRGIAVALAVAGNAQHLAGHLGPALRLLGLRAQGVHRHQRVFHFAEGIAHRLLVAEHGLVAQCRGHLGAGAQPAALQHRRQDAAAQAPQPGRCVQQLVQRVALQAGREVELHRGQQQVARGGQAGIGRGHALLGLADVGPAAQQHGGHARVHRRGRE